MENYIILWIMIISYVASIFINRWMNFYVVKKEITLFFRFKEVVQIEITPFIWFTWFIAFVFFSVVILNYKYNVRNLKIVRWFFTGEWNNNVKSERKS